MAIVKIKTAKRNIKGIIDYVTNPEKTNELLISGKDCTPETASIEMQVVKEQYNKTDGNTYFHVIQSFSPDDNITPEKAHEVGVNFADYFKDYQVLIATHTDKNHLHNHLIVNSVSFENGKKVHMSNKDLERLKQYSNFLCNHYNLKETPIKNSKVKDLSQNEIAVAQRGESWKFKLINDIDECLLISNTKEDYIRNMNYKGYEVIWTDTRKYITYITPDGNRCRDRSLHDEKYLKEEMENAINGRIKTEKSINTNAFTNTNANTNEGRIYNNKSRFMGINNNLDREHSRQNENARLQNRQTNFGRYGSSKFKKRTEGDFTGRNPRSDERVYREITRTAINKMETHNFERNSNRDTIRFTCNTALDKIVALSYLLQNKRYNQDRPRRTIRSFRSLSKQAQKEWLNKHRYSSSFNWVDELEM